MNYYIDDKDFVESKIYENFMKENEGLGSLEIRASSVDEALPIKDLNVEVSTDYLNNKIIFFKGVTDSSGMIKKLDLPTPKITTTNEETPNKRVYKIEVNYPKNNFKNTYLVNIYEGVCVLQNINIVPSFNIERIEKWL